MMVVNGGEGWFEDGKMVIFSRRVDAYLKQAANFVVFIDELIYRARCYNALSPSAMFLSQTQDAISHQTYSPLIPDVVSLISPHCHIVDFGPLRRQMQPQH